MREERERLYKAFLIKSRNGHLQAQNSTKMAVRSESLTKASEVFDDKFLERCGRIYGVLMNVSAPCCRFGKFRQSWVV